jgi:hypothetical protein
MQRASASRLFVRVTAASTAAIAITKVAQGGQATRPRPAPVWVLAVILADAPLFSGLSSPPLSATKTRGWSFAPHRPGAHRAIEFERCLTRELHFSDMQSVTAA